MKYTLILSTLGTLLAYPNLFEGSKYRPEDNHIKGTFRVGIRGATSPRVRKSIQTLFAKSISFEAI